jgi:hypothetical protein
VLKVRLVKQDLLELLEHKAFKASKAFKDLLEQQDHKATLVLLELKVLLEMLANVVITAHQV